MEFEKIKLIIWDLDDTYWRGTLSEGSITVPEEHISLIKNLTDCGIINSICSKNNESEVSRELEIIGLTDYFVFKSINWDPKGKRVATIIKNMGLRPANVLFIDDNHQNIKEVEFYNEGIMAELPNIISDLEKSVSKLFKKDIKHKRLKQYQVLEAKYKESQSFLDNTAFLRSCDIRIEFCHDCVENIDRLHELILRTNQLNYTKKRPTKEEFLRQLQEDGVTSGYVKVHDRFGDYGVVGFYLIHDNKLTHFLFSCRTIGQGVEQFVYAKIGFPYLEIIQPVASGLDNKSCPDWITEGMLDAKESIATQESTRVLFKGPCDMQGMVGYLQMGDNLDAEFTFTNDKGELIETHNHSAHIYGLNSWGEETKERLQKECFFMSPDCYSSRIYTTGADIIFLSTLIEGMYGLYKNRATGEIVAYGHYNYPVTEKENWSLYLSKKIQTYGYQLTLQDLVKFSSMYEFVGRRTPEDYVGFISYLLDNIPSKSTLCLILGTELEYLSNTDTSYASRHLYHKELNNRIRDAFSNNPRIRLLDIDSAVSGQKDFSNNINHYTPSVYYKLSLEILNIIKDVTGEAEAIKVNRVRFILKQYIQPFILKFFPQKIYCFVRNIGRAIAGDK